jgi:hypothetical protein
MIEVLRTGECRVYASNALEGASPIFIGSVDRAVTNAVAALPSSVSGARDGTSLQHHVRRARGARGEQSGFFLRAETMAFHRVRCLLRRRSRAGGLTVERSVLLRSSRFATEMQRLRAGFEPLRR